MRPSISGAMTAASALPVFCRKPVSSLIFATSASNIFCSDFAPATLHTLAARLLPSDRPQWAVNMIVTNVPGPQLPLYILGARMVDNFGFLPLIDSLCLGVVLFSYAGKLCWGFTGEWDLLPDLHDFAGDIEASFRELSAAPKRTEIQAVHRKAALSKGRTRRAQPTPRLPEQPPAGRVAL